MAEPNTNADPLRTHWAKTKALMVKVLIVWFFFAFGIHVFAGYLNQFVFLGFPLGWYMAAQGSLIVFVVLVFWFARRQNQIDVRFGMAEDE